METDIFTPLHERLRIAAGSRTYRQLGDLTGTNHETVRRYMLGQAPSAEFLAAVCGALDINAQWLLVGAGAMKGTDIRAHSLGEAKVSELLSAMSTTLERLMDRVDRLESYMQVLETHVRAQAGDTASQLGSPKADIAEWANNPPVRGIETPHLGADHAPTDAQRGTKERIDGVVRALPNDHVRLLIELLRPAGAELARRWVAALLVVDENEREAMVAAVEKQVVQAYGIARDYSPASGQGDRGEVTVIHPPVQKSGYIEQIEATYSSAVPSVSNRARKSGAAKNSTPKARRQQGRS